MTQPPDERDERDERDALGALAQPDAASDHEALTEPGGPGGPAGPETLATAGSPAEPEALAPMGGLAEPEPPRHAVDPDAASDDPVEDSVAYELAVEDGAPFAPEGDDPGAGDLAPEFRPPGEG